MWRFILAVVVIGVVGGWLSTLGKTDQDRVSSILRNTSYHAKEADAAFQESLSAIESLRAGRPPYQVADILNQQYEQLDRHVVQIARPYNNEAMEIKDAAVRERVRAGINAIHLAHENRRRFVHGTQEAINRGDRTTFKEIMRKRQTEGQAFEEATALTAFAYFAEARKAVGLPPAQEEAKK
jgi:acyl-CoA reductase-like NAD-dependent aldehyde dehydrogenase